LGSVCVSRAFAAASALTIRRRTLYRIETGEPCIALGTFIGVLWKLGLLDTVGRVADPEADDHGKILKAAVRPQRVHLAAVDNDL
jgi:hypothetical protein